MNDVQIKISKNGSLIPVLNGVYLHSMYNPEKEAQSFIQNHLHQVEGNKNFLILGLGFGYHVDALIEQLKGEDYYIYVLEPCIELVEAFNEKKPCFDNRVEVTHIDCIEELYQQLNFADFLSNKPIILPHSTSFNMNQAIFKKFMNFKASSFIEEYLPIINDDIKYKFDSIPSDWTLDDYFQQKNKDPCIEDLNDIFFLALNEILNDDKEVSQ